MNQGEIWLVNFSPNIGDEISKTRPALIVSNNALGKLKLKVVAPITDGTSFKQSWHVPLKKSSKSGLTKNSVADCFQIKSISNTRFLKLLGSLSEDELDEIKIAMAKVLSLI